jgi:hypothetical protein
MEARRRAGEVVLRWLVPFADEASLKALGGLRLKQVTIRYGAEGIVKETLDVGEVRVP